MTPFSRGLAQPWTRNQNVNENSSTRQLNASNWRSRNSTKSSSRMSWSAKNWANWREFNRTTDDFQAACSSWRKRTSNSSNSPTASMKSYNLQSIISVGRRSCCRKTRLYSWARMTRCWQGYTPRLISSTVRTKDCSSSCESMRNSSAGFRTAWTGTRLTWLRQRLCIMTNTRSGSPSRAN